MKRAWRAPEIASRTVFHGKVTPASWDKAVAMAFDEAEPSCHALARFSGKSAAAEIAAGGRRNFAEGIRIPAGISSDSRLAGSASNHTRPDSTASPIATLTTSAADLGTVIGSTKTSSIHLDDLRAIEVGEHLLHCNSLADPRIRQDLGREQFSGNLRQLR
jgi:hypothetical protein